MIKKEVTQAKLINQCVEVAKKKPTALPNWQLIKAVADLKNENVRLQKKMEEMSAIFDMNSGKGMPGSDETDLFSRNRLDGKEGNLT